MLYVDTSILIGFCTQEGKSPAIHALRKNLSVKTA